MILRESSIIKIKDFLYSYFIRGLFIFLALIPLPITRAFAKGLSFFAFLFMTKRVKLANRNLQIAFDSKKSRQEINKITKNYFFNVIYSVFELGFYTSKKWDEIKNHFEVLGLENFQIAKAKNKGILFATAHFGNFGLMSHIGSFLLTPTTFVVQKGRLVRTNEILTKKILGKGNNPVYRQNALQGIDKAFHEKKAVAVMVDIRAGKGKDLVPINLFGKRFYLNKGPALLALHYQVPVLPVYLFRKGTKRFSLEIGKEIPIRNFSPREKAVEQNLQRIVNNLEGTIRAAPDHWLYWAWRGFEKNFIGESDGQGVYSTVSGGVRPTPPFDRRALRH